MYMQALPSHSYSIELTGMSATYGQEKGISQVGDGDQHSLGPNSCRIFDLISNSVIPFPGEKSRSKSPQLTVGQGWFGGSSENILRQTKMALGLWEHLHETASTPSTVVPPLKPSRTHQQPANSAA